MHFVRSKVKKMNTFPPSLWRSPFLRHYRKIRPPTYRTFSLAISAGDRSNWSHQSDDQRDQSYQSDNQTDRSKIRSIKAAKVAIGATGAMQNGHFYVKKYKQGTCLWHLWNTRSLQPPLLPTFLGLQHFGTTETLYSWNATLPHARYIIYFITKWI